MGNHSQHPVKNRTPIRRHRFVFLLSGIVLLLIMTPSVTVAQTNYCVDATPISEGTDIPFDTGTNDIDDTPWGCGTAAPDVWFAYTASCAGIAIIETTQFDAWCSADETILQAFSACNGTLIDCDETEGDPPSPDNLSKIFLDVTAGSTYYLRISASGASWNLCQGAGLLDISCGQSIGSDECVDATPTGEGTNIIVDTTNATYNPNDPPNCGPSSLDTPDAWIAYTASCTGIATIRTNSGTPFGAFSERAVVEVFDACGGTALDCVNWDVPSEIFLPVTRGSTYFIRVLGINEQVGLIVLDISCDPIVGSDECANATPVSEGEGIFVDTSSATADATGASCYTDEYPDAWIAYTPSTSGTVTIESTHSNENYPGPGPYGNAIEVLDVCGGNVLACDQNNYPGVTMELGFVTPKNTYLIRIASRHRDFPPPADTGLNRFNITLAAIENPVCEAATTISPGTISTDTTGALLTDDIDHLTNCGDSAEWDGENCNSEMRHPIWFTWTAPTSGTIALNTCGDNCFDDSVLAFYEGECADLLLLECSCYEHHGSCGYYEEYMAALMHPVEAGVTYYIQLGSGGAEAGGDCEMVFDFFADEDCFNGIDDDGDGLIDCEDQPCSTGIFEQTSPDQSDFGEFGGERGQAGVFADFDDDGDNDFFAANNYHWGEGHVDVLWINQGGDQGGTPGEFEPSSQLFPEEETEDVAAGDLDGDGDLDIFCVGKKDHRVWLNDGNGNFTNDWTQDGTPEGWFSGSETVELFDLDDDNDLDAVIGVRFDGLAQVYANNGDGIFTHMPNSADPTDLDANGSRTNCIALGDFDLDGNTDIFLGRAHHIDRIWRGDGFGSFEDTGAIFPSTTTSSVSTSDLDGDGDLDLVITSVPSGNSVDVDPEDAIHGTQIWLNDGSGSFVESGQILNEDYHAPHHTLVDLNMDGHLDLYLADQIGVLDHIWLNDGSGTFYDAQVALEIRTYDSPPIIGDANNDGIPDLLYRQGSYNYLYLHTFLNMNCLPENCDNRIDDDNDGLIDCADPECTESNGVGCDDDGDGIPNVCDIDSTGGEDCDSDGQDDSCQLAAEDPDGDGDINPCDPDDDNDGYADGDDNCPSVANEDQGDNDRDGIGDVCDTDDIDGDGVLDFEDSAPLDPYQCRDVDNDGCDDCSSGVDNPAEDGTDIDSDGLCDFGDPDDDDDGVLDGDDNCPIVPNPDQNEVLVAEATQIDFALRTFSDDATVLELEDDDVQSVTIPFAIPFAGGSYTEVFVSSNGFVTFDSTDDSGCCNSQDPLPTVGEPNNLVAGYWNDLDPSSGGTIKWEVFGEEGARELVIGFEEVPHCCSDGNSEVSFQIVLSEAGYAEVHCDICHDDDEGYHTQGAEGPNGQLAAVLEDRNYAAFTLLEDGARYVLQALDNDQDGLNDQCDVDDDNDGVPDSDDDAPFDNTICRDLDNDGCDDCSSGVDDPAADGPDTDADGQCDFSDPDDDNDGVADGDDNAPLDNTICRDLDNDGCDDCSSGVDDPSNDGADFDNDGICDAGDDDDDNDGSLDTDDDDDNNPNVCSDTDGDGCDDCSNGSYDPSSDGVDFDNDGICDASDDDDDNDGSSDTDDDDDNNPNVCSDTDGDGCDDCSSGIYDPSSDGADYDNDGLCDDGDDDDDNDGALDDDDDDDNNPNVCSDTDGDGCDDCSNGSYDPSSDGVDFDNDGICDAGDDDDDNDGSLDTDDDDDNNPNVCSDTDGDGCDDCSNGSYDPSNDGADFDNDGLCDDGDDDDDNDGSLDTDDDDDNNPNVCSDTDGDGCDDCSSGTYAPSDDGTDTDGDGLCDSGDPDPNGWYLHFIRGDANNDGRVDTADAIYTLAAQFYGGPQWPCRDSADINNDEEIDVADAVYCLSYIFLDGAAPLAPFPDCGQDEAEPAGLTCEVPSPGCP